MVSCDKCRLTEDDREVLWGYAETWEAHALKISVEKKEVEMNEIFRITVKDESNNPVKNATVHIDSYTFSTDLNGSVEVKISKKGVYEVYAEKEGYVRSEKVEVKVIKKSILLKWIEKILHSINSIIEFFLRLFKFNQLITFLDR